MKLLVFWLYFIGFLKVCFAGDGGFSFDVLVVDDLGKPIEEAMVEHAFISDSLPLDKQRVVLFTGTDGLCHFFGAASDLGRLRITKNGWYTNIEKLSPFFSRRWNRLKDSGGDWDPAGKILRTVFKVKGESIPMYAKNETILLPKNATVGQSLSYDLEIGDWVTPFGRGKRADFIFSCEIRGDSEDDLAWKLQLEFSNSGDGIQGFSSIVGMDDATFRGSELRSPKTAPLSGFESKMEWKYSRSDSQEAKQNHLYIFRVRTILDEAGNVVEAMYGKIYGSAKLDRFFRKESDGSQKNIDGLLFSYYFNPSGTRNLEFNTKRNLLLNLAPECRVYAP